VDMLGVLDCVEFRDMNCKNCFGLFEFCLFEVGAFKMEDPDVIARLEDYAVMEVTSWE
jgi:hypothetical protein